MLSIVLYGRNDSHGYNLHKRAALSLNAIAEVLSGPDDEIVFVDYNTPDELPTFLETIADTLTDRAKGRLRIIRVRPSFHRQFANRTKLVALESQSRNIAIRRANPANRWILSTNTDMIFVPRDPAESLGAICGSLPDGFYHLPRFELPESFWERADRLDPQGMIGVLREHGRRYHLNEIVYGGYDNVYEAPGDFQLFLREDLHRIGGFDETMIMGWHVDTNTARRMKLLRGKVDTAFPLLSGYHCGHTRQATSLHGAKRTENSLEVYAKNVSSAAWTHEPEGWGYPQEAFEEIRLTEPRATLFLSALDKAVTSQGPEYSEATYNETTYCEEGFDADHVLPHLADLVFNLPPDQTIFMVGSDADLLGGFERFASSPPVNARLFFCADDESPGESFPAALLDLETGLARADLVVIQFPNVRSVFPAMRADLEWYAQHALERFIEIERLRDRADRRRVIVVNGMHTRLQDLIWETLDAAAIPFSGRIRHGRVVDSHWPAHPPVKSLPYDQQFYRLLGRQRAFAPSELATLARIFNADDGSPSLPGWERLAPEINAVASHPEFLTHRLGVSPDKAGALAALARSAVQRAAARCATTPVDVAERTGAPNRIASTADWESEDWLALAMRYFGERAYTLTTRSRWLWERTSLLHELRQRVSPVTRPWVLVLAEQPEVLAAMAAHQGYRVAYASAEALLRNRPTPDWRADFRGINAVLPGSLLPLDRTPESARFAAILAPGGTFLSNDAQRAQSLFDAVATRIDPGAHVGVSTLIHLNQNRGGGAIGLKEFEQAFATDGVMHALGIDADAPIDPRIPIDAAVRFALEDKETETAPGLSFGFDMNAIVSIGMLWGRLTGGNSGRTPRGAEFVRQTRQPAPASPVHAADVLYANALPTAASPPLPIRGAARRPAGVTDGHPAFAAAQRAAVFAYPTLFGNLRRDLLPSIVSPALRERNMVRAVLEGDADGVVRFAVPLANFGPGVCSLHIGLAGDCSGEIGASFVGSLKSLPGTVSMSHGVIIVTFEAGDHTGDGLAVFEFTGGTLEINVLSATREALAALIAN